MFDNNFNLLLNNILSTLNSLDKTIVPKKNPFFDFRSSKTEMLKKDLDRQFNQFLMYEKHLRKFENIQLLFNNIKSSFSSKDLVSLKRNVSDLRLCLPSPNFKVDFALPSAIKDEIEADIVEIQMCFDSGCYRSAVILCGRILEAVLHRKYFEITNKDILETNPGIGLGKLIAKLREENFTFPPGISEQIHLINKARISSVHKKSEVFIPSKEQCNAIVLFSLDILKKLF